ETPTPACSQLAVRISMPAHMFQPGDDCHCEVYLCNPTLMVYPGVPLLVALDVYGEYFFAPSFQGFDRYVLTLTPGLHVVSVVSPFNWPEGAGAVTGIRWLAAMTNQEMTDIFGQMDSWDFGWEE
ncbi:hypothetical protein JW905_15630, partial [bacterium]|nr:hypothetical protein [candidate division CSSED10-310 bacterium]